MINQRGQAFSVFELMIAAIVAIAILFVLLPIINDLITPRLGDPVIEIGNNLALNTYNKKTTSEFKIESGATVRSSYFKDKTIDPCSFYFDRGRFSDKQIDIGIDDDFSDGCDFSMSNISSNDLTLKAAIICETNADALESSLNTAKLDFEYAPTSVWGSGDEYKGFDKVCVVVLQYP
ncbi:MAG: hypothetical protein WC915_02180 [archaeon]|jgi:hypothetical protein